MAMLICKPNSVYPVDGQSPGEIIIYLGPTSPSASSDLPASVRTDRSAVHVAVLGDAA